MSNTIRSAVPGVVIAGLIAIGIVVSMSFVVVQPGTVGVVTKFGAVQDDVLPEGLHMVMPVKTKVILLDVRVQKVETEASASSKDLQIVTSKVAINFYLNKKFANIIFQELGPNYHSTIIHPTIQESVKSATAQFTAEQLITKRDDVKKAIFDDVLQRLETNNIVVTDFSIIDFNFSAEFNRAIEEKQVAEQSALRAENDLVRIKTEAEQVRAQAEGLAKAKIENATAEAEAQRMLLEVLNPDIIQLRAIERWDGKLPLVMGNEGGAFFDVVGAMKAKRAGAAR